MSDDVDGPSQVDIAQQVEVQPSRSSSKKVKGFYKEADTIVESDVDEPKSYTITEVFVNEYVIYNYRGTYFPGKVVKVLTKSGTVSINTMTKYLTPASSWRWTEEQKIHMVAVETIYEKIKPPKLVKFGQPGYIVEKIESYGWQLPL